MPTNARTVAALVGGLALSLTLAFFAGRYTAPVETKTVTETVYSTRTIRTVVVDRQVDTKWRRVIVAQPDGSSVTTEVGETHEVTKSADNSEIMENGRTKEVSEKTQSRPNWSLIALVGLNVRGDWKAEQPTFGVILGRRLLGPTWVHLYAQTNGTVGVGAGLEF